MGGFMLFDGTDPKEVLTPQRLEELYNQGAIAFPTVTEEEINDRSKADAVSKGLVLMHTIWFITQVATRFAEGCVTQLELVTLGYAVLTGVFHFFWWDKPFDVQLPIPVHLIHPTSPSHPGQGSSSMPSLLPLFILIHLQSHHPAFQAVQFPSTVLRTQAAEIKIMSLKSHK
jgi:hypothetical protein